MSQATRQRLTIDGETEKRSLLEIALDVHMTTTSALGQSRDRQDYDVATLQLALSTWEGPSLERSRAFDEAVRRLLLVTIAEAGGDFFPFPYPKIPGAQGLERSSGLAIGFLKLDGTCLSAPWLRGVGFGPLATRRGEVIKPDHGLLGEACAAFESIKPALEKALEAHADEFVAFSKARVYFEFLGERSFAGLHRKDEPKRLVAIDALIDERDTVSLLGPREFMTLFPSGCGVETPKVVWKGVIVGKALAGARDGSMLPPGAEGVVFKGGSAGVTWAFKLKSRAWEERLKDVFKDGKWQGADAIEHGVDEDSA